MTLVYFVLIFGLVVIAHEFGHFLLAKVNGIRVNEFARIGILPVVSCILPYNYISDCIQKTTIFSKTLYLFFRLR